MSSTTDPIPPNTPGMLTSKPIPTPTHGSGGAGSFSVGCSTTVAAAPLVCLDVVLNSSKYPEWNNFCKRCTIDSQPKQQKHQAHDSDSDSLSRQQTAESVVLPAGLGEHYLRLGTKFTFDVHMNLDDGNDNDNDNDTAVKEIGSGRPTQLEVSVLEPINEVVPVESPSSSRRSSPRSSVASADGAGLGHRRRQSTMSASSSGSRRKYVRRTGWRVAWKTRTSPFLPGWMLRSERVQEFVQIDPAPFDPFGPVGGEQQQQPQPQTAYACWETFYGVLAPVVRLSVGLRLVKGFETWMGDMKGRAEELERTERRGWDGLGTDL